MTHPRRVVAIALLSASLVAAAPACGSLPQGIGGALAGGGAAALDDGTIADGLREALRIGSERAVGKTASLDGFLRNKLIRLVLPEELESMGNTLRKIGLSRQVDELETSMNRAAEKASGEAVAVFVEAVQGLTIDDARRILQGGKQSATKLLRERTTPQLTARIRPIVSAKMDEVGLSRLYADLAAKYNALPLGQRPATDLDAYVTEKTLSGVFTMLGKEEERIREDPVARTTELLQRVFR